MKQINLHGDVAFNPA